VNKMNKRIYAGTTLMIIIPSILIEIKSYNTVFIRIKIAIILLTFILIGISSYIKLKSYKS
jgi:Tfp pilus assembly major pilin PilA